MTMTDDTFPYMKIAPLVLSRIAEGTLFAIIFPYVSICASD